MTLDSLLQSAKSCSPSRWASRLIEEAYWLGYALAKEERETADNQEIARLQQTLWAREMDIERLTYMLDSD